MENVNKKYEAPHMLIAACVILCGVTEDNKKYEYEFKYIPFLTSLLTQSTHNKAPFFLNCYAILQ